MKNNLLTIGQLASASAVHIQTIRYYEKRQLIGEPQRSESGYRLYHPAVIQRIRFIKRAQELGFSLNEIQELLALRVDATNNCDDVRLSAQAKLTDINEKITTLQRMSETLTELIQHCQNKKVTSPCPILKTLEKDEQH